MSSAADPNPPLAALFERVTRRRGVRQFIKFGLVGASGFVVNLVIFTALQHPLSLPERVHWYYIIYSIAFLSGGVSNYVLNRIWTFRSTGHALREGVSFISVSVAALIVALIVGHLVAPFVGNGHKNWFISTVAAMVVNFLVNKYWTFRSVL
ncbi:MAG TPA: GtrA family protein [Candidatus Binatia bacterium]|nr:GtrA family protein [Candidatus Binatia bacterium]